MYKVTFASPVALDGDSQNVFQSECIEPSIEFALALHRSSNVAHVIEVVLQPLVVPSSEDVVCLTLSLKENPTERK